MFGSDQIVWPDALPIAVEAVESADFLNEAQKQDNLLQQCGSSRDQV